MEGSKILLERAEGLGEQVGTRGLNSDQIRRAGRFFHEMILKYRTFFVIVVAPTFLTAFYYFAIAANQYESQADFVVKTAAQTNTGYGSGLAQMFGIGGAMNPSQGDSYSVSDFLNSHDAVTALRKRMDLVAMFRRPEADLLSALRWEAPAAEDLLRYYRQQVDVTYSPETGITTLTVRAFRPSDAERIARTLLQIGEQRVNLLNQRALGNAQRVAEDQLAQAEAAVAATQVRLTLFRQAERDIDPEHTGIAQITMQSSLQQQLALARAELSTMRATIDITSPQYTAQIQRVKALETQVAGQAGRSGSMAQGLSTFEALKVQQDFATKRYEAAASTLQTAREQALKQQLYVVRIVDPSLPEKALHPRRWKIVLSVLCATLLIYGIGTLILAGVREHAS